jgi:putative DNA primase/helicase
LTFRPTLDRGFGVFDSAGPFNDAGKLSDEIKGAARAAYGTAGPAFVRRIADEGYSEIGQFVTEFVENFRAPRVPPGADGQVGRAAERLGLIAAAGELATEWGIVPWKAGEATDAASRALADWIANRGGSDAAEIRDAISQVRHFIEANGEARFEPMPKSDRPVVNRAGWRKGGDQDEPRQWLILPETWKAEVCAGYDPVATARALAARGMLIPDSNGKFQRPERTPYGTKRVYVVIAAILEG